MHALSNVSLCMTTSGSVQGFQLTWTFIRPRVLAWWKMRDTMIRKVNGNRGVVGNAVFMGMIGIDFNMRIYVNGRNDRCL